MGTSMVCNGDRGIWVHDGVGEVWLAALSALIRQQTNADPALLELSQKIDEDLEAGWVVGPLMFDFGSLLKKPGLLAAMHSLHEKITEDWQAQAASGSLIVHGKWQAAQEFALPELKMLGRLFFNPASVPMPAHIHLPGKGWRLA